jgi:HEAT repeat protein
MSLATIAGVACFAAPASRSAAVAPAGRVGVLLAARDGHEEGWRAACEALAAMGPAARQAVPELLAVLKNPREGRRRVPTLYALARISPDDPAVLAAVAGALGDSDRDLRDEAAIAIGDHLSTRPQAARVAVPALVAVMQKDRSSSFYAGDALAKFGTLAAPAAPALTAMLAPPPPGPATKPTPTPPEGGAAAMLAEMESRGRRVMPARILGRIGPAAKPAVAPLAAMLSSPDKWERAAAAEALGDLGAVAKEAAPALAKATQDAEPDVRFRAALALGRVGFTGTATLPAFAAPLKDELAPVRTAYAIGAAGASDPAGRQSILKLLEATKVRDLKFRSIAFDEVRKPGASALPALAAALDSPDWRVRINAAIVLSQLTRSEAVRASAAAPGAVRALADRAKDPDIFVRDNAVLALGHFRSPDGVTVLLAALKEPAWNVRASAAVSLSQYAETAAAPQVAAALSEALRDEHRWVRYAAAKSLEKLGPAAGGALPALTAALRDRDGRPIEWPAWPEPLSAEEKAMAEGMNKTLDNVRVCDAAAAALGAVGPAAGSAVPALVEQLKDPNGADHRYVVRALGGIGPTASAAVPLLVERLKDEKLQYDAAGALARMGEPGATALAAALKDKALRYTAVQELVRCGGAAAGPVAAVVSDPDAMTRDAAADALAGLGPRAAAAAPALAAQLAKEGSFTIARDAQLKALVSIGPAAVAPLAELLPSANEKLRLDVIGALGSIGPDAAPAVPALTKWLRSWSPDTRAAAARALGRIGPAARPAVAELKALRDRGADHDAQAASKALESIDPSAAR